MLFPPILATVVTCSYSCYKTCDWISTIFIGQDLYSFITRRDCRAFSRFNRGFRGRGGTAWGYDLHFFVSAFPSCHIGLKAKANSYSFMPDPTEIGFWDTPVDKQKIAVGIFAKPRVAWNSTSRPKAFSSLLRCCEDDKTTRVMRINNMDNCLIRLKTKKWSRRNRSGDGRDGKWPICWAGQRNGSVHGKISQHRSRQTSVWPRLLKEYKRGMHWRTNLLSVQSESFRLPWLFGIVNVSRLTYRILMKEVEEGTRE
jgi:hypothetical protein